jgi:ribonuclease D
MSPITETGALAEFCRRLAGADYVTVDTEFMREKTYWPVLCLVQVAGPDEAAAIDPLAPGIDLAPLFGLMADRSVLKVFHAARQDVEIFFHLTGAVPTPLFDTQIAAMVCGFGEAASYETLANKLAGAAIDKSSRFTDWSRRPLSERQLTYALADVVPLRKVYEKLEARLARTGRAGWVAEEMAALSDPALYRVDPAEAWRRLKPRTANRRVLALARELAAWRELAAQRRDIPRNRLVRDEALLEIASHPPKTTEDLTRVRAFGRGLAEGRIGAEIMAVVARARDLPDEQLPLLPTQHNIPSGLGPLIELLKVLLRLSADEAGVAPRLIADNDDLAAIAADDFADIRALQGWRAELFGRDALDLKHGRLALGAAGSKIERLHLAGPESAAAQ